MRANEVGECFIPQRNPNPTPPRQKRGQFCLGYKVTQGAVSEHFGRILGAFKERSGSVLGKVLGARPKALSTHSLRERTSRARAEGGGGTPSQPRP